MLALNAPKKLVARIQTLVCLGLAFLCLMLSFISPLVSIDFKEAKTINDALQFLEESGVKQDAVGEIPEKINVSAVKMYGVVGTLVSVVKAATNKDTAADAAKGAMSAMFDENGKLKEGAKNSMLIAAAIATNIVNEAKDGSSDSNKGIGKIISMVITVVATIALLIFSMIAPIYYIIAFLGVLINVLKNLQNPEDITAKVAGRLPKTIVVPTFIMFFACVTKTLTPGSGVKTLFMLVLLNSLLNLVATRMHGWDKTTIKYANVVQGISLASILGYIIFLFNIIKTSVFRTLITNNGFLLATGKAVVNAAADKEIVEKQAFLPDLFMVLIAIWIVLFSARYLSAVLRRATLSVKEKDQPSHILFSIVLMFSAILPMVVKTLAHDTTKTPAVSYLEPMTNAQNSALIGALVGLIIIFVSEIALIVLQKVFCEDITEQEIHQVLTNTAISAEEKVENAKAILEREGVAVPTSAEVKENKTEE